MARKETTIDQTTQRLADPKDDSVDPKPTTVGDTTNDSPTLSDGHDQIVEEAPGIHPATDVMSPTGDPGDLGTFERSALLPDDLGADIGDDSGFGGSVDPGADAGSTLLDDLGTGSDVPDPNDGFDGMSDGWSAPVVDDQTGWDRAGSEDDAPLDHFGVPMESPTPTTPPEPEEQPTPDDYDDSLPLDHFGNPPVTARQTDPPPPGEDDDGERQGEGSDDPPDSETMPAPEDGTGGDPDIDDLMGGRGDVDPPRETEDNGGGELIGGRGDVDPAPETEDSGAVGELDRVAAGMGAVDPLGYLAVDGESTLLGGDSAMKVEKGESTLLGGDSAMKVEKGESTLLGGDSAMKVEKGEATLLGDGPEDVAADSDAATAEASDDVAWIDVLSAEAGADGSTEAMALIDPLGDETTLLGNDTGDLADMGADADLVVIAIEVDDSLVDVDTGEDV